MKDGLQNISFDRVLMRIKDILGICSNIVSILVMIVGALWIGFKFIEAQNQQQQLINTLLQDQIGKKIGR